MSKYYIETYDARHRRFSPTVTPEFKFSVNLQETDEVVHVTDWAISHDAIEAAQQWIESQEIEVGDIVYQNRRGWSGVPMRVLELSEVSTPNGPVVQAVCEGASGWTLNELISRKYGTRVGRFAVANLSKTANVAIGG